MAADGHFETKSNDLIYETHYPIHE